MKRPDPNEPKLPRFETEDATVWVAVMEVVNDQESEARD